MFTTELSRKAETFVVTICSLFQKSIARLCTALMCVVDISVIRLLPAFGVKGLSFQYGLVPFGLSICVNTLLKCTIVSCHLHIVLRFISSDA